MAIQIPFYIFLAAAIGRSFLVVLLSMGVSDALGGDTARAAEGGDESVCGGCHPENTRLSHPLGMVPSMAIPADLPVDAYGRVTCTTCHLHHDQIVATGSGLGSLRRPSIAALCRSCHRNEAVLNHRGTLPFAHAAGRDTDALDPRGIDRRSLACLGCHDGLHPEIGSARSGRVRAAGLSMNTSHPIGVELAERGRPGGRGAWRQPVDERIHLFDHRVGCPSCHDPFSPAPEKLVMDNHGSRLCFGCHVI
ncbi:MAG: hypothetical protein COW73_01435 [Nitrospirae bacterium CG18_big_fil_WC_8_21_14_2_50_70_55]|nr:hypothetical protein [Deltaproteobacteria bacterium]OIP64066.1 MAG: hypothetical protein AUK30_07290 [Nitrospirae bacterium CG2_30_70_394]PIQ06976.1 MAG: hypothetical protein COW73_01435 [Nitrospirae bacterium CG18_big_fil_WC_8_21_14_2_50_70_55]PIU78542.1 MAG: hypothetical protein COS73_06860 [Nitrospirae bacterium CG06_land_8_20_14_3_00_70_43]PIW83999.1 MAG: hypothetical protein COZ96_00380 [Nitrospirae bacterium CG_4_8_14_3_um_filter_70_85]PIX84442.1 MAG: hypothetical protein COZ33_00225 